MYTTFSSFKGIGACGGGRSRFLDIIGGSSKALPLGGKTRLPVWIPLLMSPNDVSELSWLFKRRMTYHHDEVEFRELFEKTRMHVARTCIMHMLSIISRENRYNDIFGLAEPRVRLNNIDKVRAFHVMSLACRAVMLGREPYDGPGMRAAINGFETVMGNSLKWPGSPAEFDGPDLHPSPSLSQLCSFWPMWRTATFEAHDGPFYAGPFEQKYFVHSLLRNLWTIYGWSEGTRVDFKDVPHTTTSQLSDIGTSPLPRPRGSAVARLRKSGRSPAVKECANKNAPIADDQPHTAFTDEELAAHSLEKLPGTYPFVFAYVEEKKKSGGKKAARAQIKDLLMRAPESDDAAYAAQEMVDPVSATTAAAATADDDDDDDDNNNALLPYLRSPSAFIIRWVYTTFDTGKFFGTLRFAAEHALPEGGITVEWLKNLSAPAAVTVSRDENGQFEGGTISVRSPRLMALLLQSMRKLQISGQIVEVAYPGAPAPAPVAVVEPTADPEVVRVVESASPSPEAEPSLGDIMRVARDTARGNALDQPLPTLGDVVRAATGSGQRSDETGRDEPLRRMGRPRLVGGGAAG